jgi:diguanylate cyclase (GGDEF)-like protein/putative nucleotidyltransferase with HDIG domain
MSSYSIIQFLTFAVYAVLLIIVFLYARTKLKKLFLLFLAASAGWSLVSFLSNLTLPSSEMSVWSRLVPVFSLWSLAAYAHFIVSFLRRGVRKVVVLGYGVLLGVIVLVVLGHCPKEFILLENGIVYKDYGASMFFIGAGGALLLGITMFLLLKTLMTTKDAEQRNRLVYLLIGISFLVVSGAIWKIIPTQTWAIDHTGNLCNALVLTYVIMKHRLFDMNLVVRKGLVYSGITIVITASFILMLYGLNYWLQTAKADSLGLVIPVGMVILMAFLFNPLRVALEKGADKLLYGNRYDYRQMVLSFASRMSNILDLEELAESMLRPIVNAVSTSQASLLIANNGHFSSQFAERLVKGEPVIPINLRRDGAIVKWFENEDKPLDKETIDTLPEFKGLWQEERNSLEAAEVELLCPIKSKHRLIAILALSKKHPRGFYSRDNTDMLMTLAHEAAVVIENAQLYAQAKQRANTDELTGLFNHRYFHERLDEEIARCSRFGNIFSLVFLDMDLFKNYNDAYGHLVGDQVLKQLGTLINQSVRNIDISCRYGGDEFAILLPETPLESATGVAERLRKGIEAQTDLKGIPQTCSIGVASWPTDGVMREEIIRSADAALYYAKQTGGNRVCLACEVALSDVLRMETTQQPQNRTAIVNTIYALAATVDAKDHHTYGHSKKVSKYATYIAEALGYSRERIETIRAAALLHDIGKIGISDQILTKREPLSSEDWEHIRAHSNLGVSILKHVDSLNNCLAAVKYHHERYDGTGYPSGLKGDNIPLDARILTVADAYDAMTSQRPYRSLRLTHEQALEELKRNAGTQFDPAIVESFVAVCTRGHLSSRDSRRHSFVESQTAA